MHKITFSFNFIVFSVICITLVCVQFLLQTLLVIMAKVEKHTRGSVRKGDQSFWGSKQAHWIPKLKVAFLTFVRNGNKIKSSLKTFDGEHFLTKHLAKFEISQSCLMLSSTVMYINKFAQESAQILICYIRKCLKIDIYYIRKCLKIDIYYIRKCPKMKSDKKSENLALFR